LNGCDEFLMIAALQSRLGKSTTLVALLMALMMSSLASPSSKRPL
jgi:hypothetical protein